MEQWAIQQPNDPSIIDPLHRRFNVGLTWYQFNMRPFVVLEEDNADLDQLPDIVDGVLSFSGTMKQGLTFGDGRGLNVEVWYDPPPRELTPSQLARATCHEWERPVAVVHPSPPAGSPSFTVPWKGCLSPHSFPPGDPIPGPDEPTAQLEMTDSQLVVQWVAASDWAETEDRFAVTADVTRILEAHGAGVYSVMIAIGNDQIFTGLVAYSLFHGVTPPSTYDPNKFRQMAPRVSR